MLLDGCQRSQNSFETDILRTSSKIDKGPLRTFETEKKCIVSHLDTDDSSNHDQPYLLKRPIIKLFAN